MPSSNLDVAPWVIDLIEKCPHDSILDVGPGYGKYGLLLREYLNKKPSRLDACEGWAPYVTPMMRAIYDEIFIKDIMLLDQKILDRYDVVLLADVIEHLTKPDAQKLLDRIRGRVVISTPEVFFNQGGPGSGLPWTETHRSHWTEDDFKGRAETSFLWRGGLLTRLRPLR